MEPILMETYQGYNINIYRDTEPENPRDWCNLGTIICFHERYNLGDKHNIKVSNFSGWSDIRQYLIKQLDAVVMLPIYVYNHSRIMISVDSYSCCDSGQIGFIYVDRSVASIEFGKKRLSKAIIKIITGILINEVKTYDMYLTGQVYGFHIEDANGNCVDSCWGYFEEPSEIIKECKLMIDLQ